MQQLKFEQSWDKALATQDRQDIERIFSETKDLKSPDNVIFSPIREAINHKEALLISVLVHNFTDYPFVFNKVRLLYGIQGEVIADKLFTLPQLVIPCRVSMPWTFIFPKGSYTLQTSFKHGQLEIV